MSGPAVLHVARGYGRVVRRYGSRCAGPVVLAGLGALAAYTAGMRRADRALARQLADEVDGEPRLSQTPRVSVLVAAWEERELLDRHVRSVLGLGYPDLEYVLCAGGADGTYELARRYARPGVTVLEQRPGEGKQVALRRCLEYATGEIVFFTDADCILGAATFARTIRPLVNGGEVAATGPSTPLTEQRASNFVLHQWAVDLYARAGHGDYVDGLIGRNAAVRADVLRACGELDHPVATGTDYYLARHLLAAGHRIRFVRRSEVQSRFETDPRRYLRQQSRWLKNMVIHGRREGARAQVAAVARAYEIGVAAVWPTRC